MNNALMFSSAKADWTTPLDFFDQLDQEFRFELDAAADSSNRLCAVWLGPGSPLTASALTRCWTDWGHTSIWVNPPYNQTKDFLASAVNAACMGATVVALIPARTDTRYWHEHVSRADEVRFLKGRLKFGVSKNSAPFPSAVVIFRGAISGRSGPVGPRMVCWDYRR